MSVPMGNPKSMRQAITIDATLPPDFPSLQARAVRWWIENKPANRSGTKTMLRLAFPREFRIIPPNKIIMPINA